MQKRAKPRISRAVVIKIVITSRPQLL
jgi:hypothetical protein